MCRFVYYGTFATVMSMLLGCAMCCGPHDDHYSLYGGKFQRVDPAHGRVGSILSDPAYMGGGPSADSNLAPETPSRTREPIDGRDVDVDSGESNRSDEILEEMERLRRELQMEEGGELPNPRTPQPDAGNDRETSRGWQNRLRGRSRQWR